MEEDEESVIENVFREEIGIDIHNAIRILNKGGVTPEVLENITDKLKKMMTDEVEIRNIPYEYRFLMLNVILCTMFNTTVGYYKKITEAIREIEKDNEIEKDLDSTII